MTTNLIQPHNESNAYTSNSSTETVVSVDGVQTSTAAEFFTVFVAAPDNYPDDMPSPMGYTNISTIVAKNEQNPRRAALIAQSRRKIAERISSDEQTLAALRLKRGLSQLQLAELIGTQQPNIARLEKGGVDPSLSTMKKLSSALEVSLDALSDALSKAGQ